VVGEYEFGELYHGDQVAYGRCWEQNYCLLLHSCLSFFVWVSLLGSMEKLAEFFDLRYMCLGSVLGVEFFIFYEGDRINFLFPGAWAA
jgi:hypothetical protein